MKGDIAQQEILLITTTTFSELQLCEKDNSSNAYSQSEHLEEACWNGLLQEFIPEIILKLPFGKKLYMWHLRKRTSFLQIELSEFPVAIEENSSINPYSFLAIMIYN